MLALTWTTLGILAAFALGVLAIQASQNARIDALRDRMEVRFDGIGGRFERIDERFERSDERFARLEERFARLDARVDRGFRELSAEIRGQGERLERAVEEHQARHHG